MMFETTVLAYLLLGFSLINIASSRPPSPIGYFPEKHHPWSSDDKGVRNEIPWRPLFYSDDYSKYGNYADSFNPRLNYIKDDLTYKGEYRPKFPTYSGIHDGFAPADLSSLDKVYWWKKRFPLYRNGSPGDIPFHDDIDDNKIDYLNGGVSKRDYTAGQLVNMLKALAKARRQRYTRIAGKGLRFGISK